MATRELFENRLYAWFLNRLVAFPVDRGAGDEAAMRACAGGVSWPALAGG
ncbi:MAG TPA: hypothetical protein VMG80_03410 [Solirubrobacteraceae bacterium]|nr:hypothetical protein [Solirubrobacteraceae bacterium]